jgi:alpha-galactosidase
MNLSRPRWTALPLSLLLTTTTSASDPTKPRLAPTPPMGWNSWEAFRRDFDEDVIKAEADALVSSGLRDAGYNYFVIDGGWKPGSRGPGDVLIEDPKKFPHGMKAIADYVHSKGLKFGLHQPAGIHDCPKLSPGSQGFEERDAALFIQWGVDFIKYDRCDYVHANDTTSGAPDIDRIVVRQGDKELFSTEAEAIQNHLRGLARVEPRANCSGGHCVTAIGYDNGALTIPDIIAPADGKYSVDLYLSLPYFGMERYSTATLFVTANGTAPQPVELPYDMSQRYTLHKATVEVTLKQGVNSITLDNPRSQEDEIRQSYLKMAHALQQSDHPIMFSVCTVPRPWLWAEPIAHLYRCETDVTDRFTGVNGAILPILDRHIDLLHYSSAGFWPDPDMLEVGRKGRIDRPNLKQPKMSDAEYRAQFSLWSIMNAPLFISMDLREIDDSVKKILLNKDVIAINQDPLAAVCRCVRSVGDQQTFVKPLSDGFAVAFLNRASAPFHVRTATADLGNLPGTWTARDLWTGHSSALSNDTIDTNVETHGVTLLRLTRTPAAGP